MAFDVALQVDRLNATVFAFCAIVIGFLSMKNKMRIYVRCRNKSGYSYRLTHVLMPHFVLSQHRWITGAERANFALHRLFASVLSLMNLLLNAKYSINSPFSDRNHLQIMD